MTKLTSSSSKSNTGKAGATRIWGNQQRSISPSGRDASRCGSIYCDPDYPNKLSLAWPQRRNIVARNADQLLHTLHIKPLPLDLMQQRGNKGLPGDWKKVSGYPAKQPVYRCLKCGRSYSFGGPYKNPTEEAVRRYKLKQASKAAAKAIDEKLASEKPPTYEQSGGSTSSTHSDYDDEKEALHDYMMGNED